MEAKDPVMDKEQCQQAIDNYELRHLSRLEAQLYTQDEISFKAGVEKVVKWVESNIAIGRHDGGCYGVIKPNPTCIACQWQAFKESIKEGK